jgi:hypothetical protein
MVLDFSGSTMPKVYLLDYVAGNIRSLVNAIEKCGWEVEWIRSPKDVEKADVSRGALPTNVLRNESHGLSFAVRSPP